VPVEHALTWFGALRRLPQGAEGGPSGFLEKRDSANERQRRRCQNYFKSLLFVIYFYVAGLLSCLLQSHMIYRFIVILGRPSGVFFLAAQREKMGEFKAKVSSYGRRRFAEQTEIPPSAARNILPTGIVRLRRTGTARNHSSTPRRSSRVTMERNFWKPASASITRIGLGRARSAMASISLLLQLKLRDNILPNTGLNRSRRAVTRRCCLLRTGLSTSSARGVSFTIAKRPPKLWPIHRFLRSGGNFIGMHYHRRSVIGLEWWIKFVLLKGRPIRSFLPCLYKHMESIGTKTYEPAELMALSGAFSGVEVIPYMTPYDLNRLPGWLARLIPQSVGFFLVVRAEK
jgi:hypothetical protein